MTIKIGKHFKFSIGFVTSSKKLTSKSEGATSVIKNTITSLAQVNKEILLRHNVLTKQVGDINAELLQLEDQQSKNKETIDKLSKLIV